MILSHGTKPAVLGCSLHSGTSKTKESQAKHVTTHGHMTGSYIGRIGTDENNSSLPKSLSKCILYTFSLITQNHYLWRIGSGFWSEERKCRYSMQSNTANKNEPFLAKSVLIIL